MRQPDIDPSIDIILYYPHAFIIIIKFRRMLGAVHFMLFRWI